MNFIKTEIEGLYIVEPKVFEDERGYFFESYNQAEFEKNGLNYGFIQDNQSKSSYGVIRGVHFQKGAFSQAKLVRVLEGKVLDVAVDLRKNSLTFGQHLAIELSAENKRQLLIPRGFGHGFSVLSETAVFAYKCDNVYNKASEGGVRFDDPALGIDWKIDAEKAILSEKRQGFTIVEGCGNMFLVTGANGQLGNELKLLLGERAVFTDYEDLDITSAEAVAAFVKGKDFETIINCAAYTAVDKAEADEARALLINAEGPANLAATGIPLIQVSTDYVFDGKGCLPYSENDEPCPCSAYGRTKLAGEKLVLEKASTAVIIRTAWLYSAFGNNFVKTMRRLGAERKSLNVVFDQIGTPTYARNLAEAIVHILPQIKPGMKEIYHFSNEGVCSWYDFARKIMEKSGLDCEVCPIESKDYPTPAERPHYSVLNKAKIKADFGVKINHWEKSLADCLQKL